MNILVSNYMNSGDNVMIFVPEEFELSATTVEMALTEAGKTFSDVVSVPDHDLQFYLYEPLWADRAFVEGARLKAASYTKKHHRA